MSRGSSTDQIPIATAPGTWGVEPLAGSGDPPWERVLDEIAEAGFDGTELGPIGFYPTEPAELWDALRSRGLHLPAAFVMESLIADPGAVSPVATQTCQLLAAVGGQVLVLIDGLDASRQATAGQSEVAVRLDQDGWDRLLACVETIADIAQTCDLRVAFHPHAGTHVEFQDEIERLMADSRVGLCVDTGHAVYSGIDPISLIRQYSERIEHIHLKDLDASQLIDGLEAGRGFVASVAAGVFTPLGQGSIDLASIALAVRRAGYEGWATYEQDRTLATLDRALADSRSSLGYARSVGF